MYYRLRFKSCPKEFLFELLQENQVKVRDVIRIAKENFKLKNARLVLFSDEGQGESLRELDDKDYIVSGRTYIVKRLPLIEKHSEKE